MQHRLWIIVLMIAAAGSVGGMIWYEWPTITNTKTTSNSNTTNTVTANQNSNTNTTTNANVNTSVTAGWKTYTNSKYNLSFDYPSDWTVTEGSTSTPYKIDVYPKTSTGWGSTSAITFWVESAYAMRCGENQKSTTSTTSIDGISATLYTTTDSKVSSCRFKNYVLKTAPSGWGKTPEITVMSDAAGAYSTQDQIIGTVQLNTGASTAGWKTYTNDSLVKITYPTSYTLEKSTEPDRRGSYEAFEVLPQGNQPYLKEIQLFSPESIAAFELKCKSEMMCFEGEYPTTALYDGLKNALTTKKSYKDYTFITLNNRTWLVHNISSLGEGGDIREYYSFVGTTLVAFWGYELSSTSNSTIDSLVEKFLFSYNGY